MRGTTPQMWELDRRQRLPVNANLMIALSVTVVAHTLDGLFSSALKAGLWALYTRVNMSRFEAGWTYSWAVSTINHTISSVIMYVCMRYDEPKPRAKRTHLESDSTVMSTTATHQERLPRRGPIRCHPLNASKLIVVSYSPSRPLQLCFSRL